MATGTLLAVVALLVVAAAGAVLRRAGDPPPAVPPAQPLPDRPPVPAGAVVGRATSISCSRNCVDAPAQVDLTKPTAVQLLTDDPRRQSPDMVLRDGRRLMVDPDGNGWSVVDPASDQRIPLARGAPPSVDVLPDGRIVTYETADQVGTGAELRIIGDRATMTWPLPDDFLPDAVTTGPGGWTAVLGSGDDECCLDHAELVLIDPDGEMRRIGIEDAVDDGAWPTVGSVSLSWSRRGLIVISPSALELAGDHPPDHPRNWAVVVDPATGDRVARLPDGWQGLAWSPDGTGLLAAQRVGENGARLRLYWGPSLRRSRDLGSVDLPFAPRWWLPAAVE